MKVNQKVCHAALIEKKNPMAELNKRLRSDRSTPHPSTGKVPAEILFNRKFNNRLPTVHPPVERNDIKEARETEMKQKTKQKEYKDSKSYVKSVTPIENGIQSSSATKEE